MIDGARDAIAEVASRYDVCVISDTIYTPGRGLPDLLTHHGLAQYLRGVVFSDQVGRSKPDPDCFRSAATQLDLDFPEILHVGDRVAKDVSGAHAVVSAYADLIRVIGDIALR